MAPVNTVMNTRVPLNAGKFLSSWATGGFSKRTQLHEVILLGFTLGWKVAEPSNETEASLKTNAANFQWLFWNDGQKRQRDWHNGTSCFRSWNQHCLQCNWGISYRNANEMEHYTSRPRDWPLSYAGQVHVGSEFLTAVLTNKYSCEFHPASRRYIPED
jgi:hypothetical protein